MNSPISLSHKADYSSVFLKSVASIFRDELSVQLKKRSVNIRKSTRPYFPISIVIGFTSDSFTGQVIYSMHHDVGEAFAKKMMPEMLPSQQKELIPSILGEIANMISGRASIELAGLDKKINITHPLVMEGKDVEFNFLQVPTIVLLLDSTIGSIEVNIGFQEK